MGSSEAEKPIKSEKPASPVKSERPPSPASVSEQNNVHMYPDWAAMQAYYGAGVALPPPYFSSSVTAGHPPHPYMWGPQPIMSPYGSPYAAMYPHGGIYAHPSLSLGSHGHGVPPSPAVGGAMVAPPLSLTTTTKSTNSKDQGSKKKLKGSNGLAVSIGNGNDDSAAEPQREENAIDGPSDGSDGNTEGGGDNIKRKRSCDTPSRGKGRKVGSGDVSVPNAEANATSSKSQAGSGASSDVAGKQLETIVPLRMSPPPELKGSLTVKRTTIPSIPDVAAPSDLWMKDERALKREKRKQSNRESARRSRLRKQAESEELALKVESLNAENLTLRSEINRLTENSERLRIENTALMEKLKNAQLGHSGEAVSYTAEEETSAPVSTENFLSRVHNSDPTSMNQHLEGSGHENASSKAKLHQLLESSPRADAVAAS